MLRKLQNKKGFTLIELLIVVAIIGILAAVAIPQFAKYRIQGFNASGNSDMRNIRTSEESLFAEWQRYGKTDNTAALPGPGGYGNGIAVTGPGLAATPNIITTHDSVLTARGLQIPVGNNVTAVCSTDATGSTFNVASKHLQGDTMYGADADSTANYKKVYAAADASSKNTGAALVLGDLPVPAAAADEFAIAGSTWKAM